MYDEATQLKHQVVELSHCLFQLTQQRMFDIVHKGHVSLVTMVMKVLPVAYRDSTYYLKRV